MPHQFPFQVANNIYFFFILQIALTSGNWEVLGRSVWVDAVNELVYFLGLRETPMEKHLYVVGLQKPDDIRLLTEPGNSYSIDFNQVCRRFPPLFFSNLIICDFA